MSVGLGLAESLGWPKSEAEGGAAFTEDVEEEGSGDVEAGSCHSGEAAIVLVINNMCCLD